MDSSRKRQRAELPSDNEDQPHAPVNNLAAEIAPDAK